MDQTSSENDCYTALILLLPKCLITAHLIQILMFKCTAIKNEPKNKSYFIIKRIEDVYSVPCLCVCPSQGVISLEPLGKKGYSIPKAGTIQVVSLSFTPHCHLILSTGKGWLPIKMFKNFQQYIPSVLPQCLNNDDVQHVDDNITLELKTLVSVLLYICYLKC